MPWSWQNSRISSVKGDRLLAMTNCGPVARPVSFFGAQDQPPNEFEIEVVLRPGTPSSEPVRESQTSGRARAAVSRLMSKRVRSCVTRDT